MSTNNSPYIHANLWIFSRAWWTLSKVVLKLKKQYSLKDCLHCDFITHSLTFFYSFSLNHSLFIIIIMLFVCEALGSLRRFTACSSKRKLYLFNLEHSSYIRVTVARFKYIHTNSHTKWLNSLFESDASFVCVLAKWPRGCGNLSLGAEERWNLKPDCYCIS